MIADNNREVKRNLYSNTTFDNGEWWYTQPGDGGRRRVSSNTNHTRMYVNGNYVSKSHPLYKPGKYKSFNDAAFTALQKDKRIKEGYVYAISNPAWPEWIKIGMAIDAEDRLNGYQTSSPMRDYNLIHYISTQDKGRLERIAHKAAAKCGEKQGEWFKITSEQAVTILDSIKEDVVDGQSGEATH